MLALPVEGIAPLLTEIAAGNPVVILQNQAFSWYPEWHYAVAIGYDLKEAELTLHSGSDAYKKVDLREFESSWALGQYWGVVVLPASKLSATGDDLAHAAAGSALEQVGKLAEAEQVYQNTLTRWPRSLGALIGLGNTRYTTGDYKGAVLVLARAARMHPESSIVKNNLATAQAAAKASPPIRAPRPAE